LKDSYDTPGSSNGVSVAGALALVADAASGLQIITIAEPAPPTLMGTYNTSGNAIHVAVDGDLALVADNTPGLQILDISDPASPTLEGTYDTSGFANGVAVAGNLAVVADRPSGLQVIDISDPASPSLLGTYDTPGNAVSVTMAGDLALLADQTTGLQIINISDPTSPTLEGSYDTPGSAQAVAVAGDLAFVADFSSGLQIIDISDPANPTLAGTYNTPGNANGVAVAGDLAFVADYAAGLQIIDISDPTNPTLEGTYGTPNLAFAVAVAGDLAFVVDSTPILQILDISDPTNPTLQDTYVTLSSARAATVAGELAFVADWDAGLKIIQVFQSEVESDNNVGRSLAVDGGSTTIHGARLTATETAGVSWELSADAGATWIPVLPDGNWHYFSVPGTDLQWRSTHTWAPGLNPTVSDLTLEWLDEFGSITSISDVPDDQGGRVHVQFNRSGYDFAAEVTYPVTGYNIYRRIDNPSTVAAVTSGVPLDDGATPRTPTGETAFALSGMEVLAREGTTYVTAASGTTFPEGTWALVGTAFATQSEAYVVEATTDGDSTVAGIDWSVYLVTTHTTTPSVWFSSSPDSGYSVDNIAPAVPLNLMLAGVDLVWEEAPEPDFQYFTIYGSPTADPMDAVVIDYAVAPTLDVTASPYPWYLVTATDLAGNEGEAAVTSNPAVDAPGGVGRPAVFALAVPRPSPFRTRTTIAFEIPVAGRASVLIYDVTGRLVQKIVDGEMTPGAYRPVWDGKDSSGRMVAPGVYFVRMQAGSFSAMQRVVRLR
jgi:hypothetical protein